MDKETLSNYGWIIVVALVGVIMLTMVTPLGNYIFANIRATTVEKIDDTSIGKKDPETEIIGIKNKKNITFELQGGTFKGGYVSTYIPGTEVALPMNVQKEHYDFGGWYPDASCTGESTKYIQSSNNTNLTFYAKWVPQQFVVTYNSNGGIFTQPNDVKYHYSYGKPFNVPTGTSDGAIQKDGYTFDGWYNANNDEPFVYTANTAGNLTLYAKWK